MLRASYLLKDSINKLQRMAKTITANSDLDVLKTRIRFECRNAMTFLNELICFLADPSEMEEAQMELDMTMREIFASTEHEAIKQELDSLPTRILGTANIERYDIHNVEHFIRMHHYNDEDSTKLLTQDLKEIRKLLKSPTGRPLTLLDAKCRDGSNMKTLKTYCEPELHIYGMEVNTIHANMARNTESFTKIAKGGLEGTKCSNNVFDSVFFYPEMEIEAKITPMHTLRPRKEFEDLKRVHNYLRIDGLLMYIIPYFRLSTHVCTFIAKNYKDVEVHRLTTNPYMVLITAIKKPTDLDGGGDEVYNKLREISNDLSKSKDIFNLNEYELPFDLLPIEIFRGNILDDEDIVEITNSTGLYSSFMQKQANILDRDEDKQPLLPFNLGQIGLVLTSGCLDGVIEELDGMYSHVIKGMVKKEEVIEEVQGEKRGDKETIVTNINKVQIKIITPDGFLKTLA